MSELNIFKHQSRKLISANELFKAMHGQAAGDGMTGDGMTGDEFRRWLADRITSFELEEWHDYSIYLNVECVIEILKYESAPKELKMFFNNLKQEQEQ
jgi:hypothetical protein